jgi:uncharacterized repeat protein (TIGR01451 family)
MSLKRSTPFFLAAVLECWLGGDPPPAVAEINAVRGGIGGVDNGTLADGDGTGSARITIDVVDLALVKQARDPSGAVLLDGTVVVPGQEIYFVLLVDNPTPYPADDIRVSDALDEGQFTYVPGTLEETVVPSGSGDAALWAGTWTSLSDAVGAPDDPASAVDTGGPPDPDRITWGSVTGQTNRTVTVPGLALHAIRFRVRVN